MLLSIFLPARKGSQRVPEKNTRKFGPHNGGLLELKLKQLVDIKEANEIVLSSNDDRCLEIGETFSRKHPKIRLDERPDHLADSETDLTELIGHASKIIDGEHILWTHVTSPFCNAALYSKIIETYFQNQEGEYDSLVTVQKFKSFLWDQEKKDIINRVGNLRWPNTQNLKELFEINNSVFLSSRSLYKEKNDRLGSNPYIYEMGKIPSFDIDEEDDFLMAEAVFQRLCKKENY